MQTKVTASPLSPPLSCVLECCTLVILPPCIHVHCFSTGTTVQLNSQCWSRCVLRCSQTLKKQTAFLGRQVATLFDRNRRVEGLVSMLASHDDATAEQACWGLRNLAAGGDAMRKQVGSRALLPFSALHALYFAWFYWPVQPGGRGRRHAQACGWQRFCCSLIVMFALHCFFTC